MLKIKFIKNLYKCDNSFKKKGKKTHKIYLSLDGFSMYKEILNWEEEGSFAIGPLS